MKRTLNRRELTLRGCRCRGTLPLPSVDEVDWQALSELEFTALCHTSNRSLVLYFKVRISPNGNEHDGAASPYLLSMNSVVKTIFVLNSFYIVMSPEEYADRFRPQLLF